VTEVQASAVVGASAANSNTDAGGFKVRSTLLRGTGGKGRNNWAWCRGAGELKKVFQKGRRPSGMGGNDKRETGKTGAPSTRTRTNHLSEINDGNVKYRRL